MENLSTKNTNTVTIIKANVTSIASLNCHNKKVRDYNILHKAVLVITLLLIMNFIWYYYAKQKGTI